MAYNNFYRYPHSMAQDKIIAKIKLKRSVAHELIRSDFAANGECDTEYLPDCESDPHFKRAPHVPIHKGITSQQATASNAQTAAKGTGIASIKKILNLFCGTRLTTSETDYLLSEFFTRDMRQVYNSIPELKQNYFKKITFKAYYDKCENKNVMCVYCKQLQLPWVIYMSHTLKDKRGVLKCPLYPIEPEVFTYDNFIDALEIITEKGLKYYIDKFTENS